MFTGLFLKLQTKEFKKITKDLLSCQAVLHQPLMLKVIVINHWLRILLLLLLREHVGHRVSLLRGILLGRKIGCLLRQGTIDPWDERILLLVVVLISHEIMPIHLFLELSHVSIPLEFLLVLHLRV